MSDAREAILGRVRTALGRKPQQRGDAPPEPRLDVTRLDDAEKIRRFRSALEALAGQVTELAAPADVPKALGAILNGSTAVASNHPFLAACGVPSLPNVQSGITDPEAWRTACATANAGITSAHALLAETGTIVLIPSPEEPRLASLLPPLHIAVVPRRRMLASLDELLLMMPRPLDNSSGMIFITGPSRTGDIEQILVRGVHGPGRVHVLIVG